MAVNKIIYGGGEVLMDLSQDSVTPANLEKGYTAHNAAGEPIDGIAEEITDPSRYITSYTGNVTDDTDWNDIDFQGTYKVTCINEFQISGKNSPSGNMIYWYGTLLVLNPENTGEYRRVQIYFPNITNSYLLRTRSIMCKRVRNNGIWSGWEYVLSDKIINLPAGIDWGTLEQGIYRVDGLDFSTSVNAPPTSVYNYGFLEVFKYSSQIYLHRYTPHASSNRIVRAERVHWGDGNSENWRLFYNSIDPNNILTKS